jgi:hypothetical protein
MLNTIEVSPIIVQDQFPNLFLLDSQEDLYDPLSVINTNYGLPPLRSYVDPAANTLFVSGPQKYESRYKNDNGIDIVIRGTYNDVMSTLDVLNKYQPLKKECDESGTTVKKRFPLYGPGSSNNPSGATPPNVPTVGIDRIGKYAIIEVDGKKYSGSGSVIFVLNQGETIDELKVVLFKNTGNSMYQETGGKIDYPTNTNDLGKLLFNSAKRETDEESLKLLSLSTESQHFVDIKSGNDDTFYRVYVYLLSTDVNKLSDMYEENKSTINSSSGYNESYRETDALGLFNYTTFEKVISNLRGYGINAPFKNISTVDNKQVMVSGRTIKAIASIINQKIISNIGQIQSTRTTKEVGSGINVITV